MYAVILICIELLKMDGAFGRLCQVTFSFIIFLALFVQFDKIVTCMENLSCEILHGSTY